MDQKHVKIKSLTLLIVIICAILISAFMLTPVTGGNYTYALKTFTSYDELAEFLGDIYGNSSGYRFYLDGDMLAVQAPRFNVAEVANGFSKDEGSVDFSETNIQVEGVDEPDVVKTDGTYLYIIAGQRVFIVLAYPVENARVLSEIAFNDGVYPENLFVNGNRLVVFGTSYRDVSEGDDVYYGWYGRSTAVIQIYDIADPMEPQQVREIEADGSYFDARMIGDYIYVIVSEYTYTIFRGVTDSDYSIDIPEITINDVTQEIPAKQIYYVDIPEPPDTMTHVLSVNVLDDTEEVTQKSFLIGSAQTMYVSQDNIYVVYTHYAYNNVIALERSWSSQQMTLIHRVSIDNGEVSYAAQGEVPGHILNQFSMDEHNGYFRIATTVWNDGSKNNLYILDMDLSRVSEIENIAPGETIYSARFMGDKAYLVTFKKIDPFFTIDLSDPEHPQILGELKIPGYSDYLHPFDENHIIGIGKDTVEPQDEWSWGRDFAWYQGIKIALFDVSDFENPTELDKIIIGDRGTDSPALRDHKAFLFDRTKELLVIPVSVYEIDEDIKQQNDGYTGNIYGEFVFQGAYVYKLSLENGFEYQGRITHRDENSDTNSWYWRSSSSITRTLYIENVLYTISQNMVKMNNLDTLTELNSLELA
jgi:uncharacterized secreted protein with C-terminal beta-propeller domain